MRPTLSGWGGCGEKKFIPPEVENTTFSPLEEGRASPQSSNVHRSDRRGCWAKWWQGKDTRATKRVEGSMLDAQSHHQSRGDNGYSSQVSGILSYLLPLPHTPFQLPDTPNCYHHRGSREKCASRHPTLKWRTLVQSSSLTSVLPKGSPVKFLRLHHCHYVPWAPDPSLSPVRSPLSIPITYWLKCKPTYLRPTLLPIYIHTLCLAQKSYHLKNE